MYLCGFFVFSSQPLTSWRVANAGPGVAGCQPKCTLPGVPVCPTGIITYLVTQGSYPYSRAGAILRLYTGVDLDDGRRLSSLYIFFLDIYVRTRSTLAVFSLFCLFVVLQAAFELFEL